MITFINNFNHKFYPYILEGQRYYRCNKCNIIVFVENMFDLTLQISSRNWNMNHFYELNLTCEEVLIKNLLE